MVSFLFLFLLFLSSIALVSSAEGNLPPHLSFENYRSILSFANDDDSKLVGELNTNGSSEKEIWDDLLETDGWNVAERNEERAKMKTTTTAEADSSSSEFPFILCHVSKSSLCGQERHDIVNSLLSKGNNGNSDSSCGYFLNPVPIYNKNNNNLRKGRTDVKEDNNKVFYATCFYSSIQFSCASQIDDEDILVTPVVPMLKIRKQFSHTTEDEQSIDETTRSLAVILSPGIFSSHEKISGFAYLLQNLQSMDGDSSLLSDCDENVFKGSSISVDSAGMTSYFFLEFQSQLSHRCIRLFMEYVVEHPQVLSIEKVAKTVAFNYEAQWITQSSIPEEKPWFEIGLTGKNQIVQVADTGVDLNHCYLKNDSGEDLIFTTNYDLTSLDETKTNRKVIQYVKLDTFGDSEDSGGHGSHVVASIAGKRSDEYDNGKDPLANGMAPDVKICFFDANDKGNEVDKNEQKKVTVPEKISSLFYFGREAGARIHSASWGSEEYSGAYNIKSQQIDEYFYDDFFDRMLMFIAAGNKGENKICDQCVSKNIMCVGASHNGNIESGTLDIDIVASFSSRGPTNDGRIKPEIIAPGHSVLSAAANSNKCDPTGGERPPYVPNENNEPQLPYEGLIYKSGTSMSCPIAAGSGALVRQYFEDGYYPSGSKQEQDTMHISGTLLKAILINGADELSKRSKSPTGGAGYNPSTFYDKYQGYGMVNLLNSLRHPDPTLDSPDLFVVNEKEIEQDQTHAYEFHNVCDAHDFRVTVVWRDPPGTSGCTECLVNDLDLEVMLETTDEIFYPNGKSEKDTRNNVERVIVNHSNFLDPETVLVKLTAANVGYNEINQQKYSLVATGCFDNGDVVFDGPDPSPTCVDADQFEYTIEVFTNRRPEETSWLFQYQASDGIISAARAGQYDELLHLYRETGCADYGCFLFTIKDTEFNGLCCEKGMGSYLIRDGSNVLSKQGDSFIDRQQTEKFCHYSDDVEEVTPSPTILVCDDDEFKYQIDIDTDLYPDETHWEILRKIDGIDEGSYTESYTDYSHEGCLDDGGCYSFSIYGYRYGDGQGEYSIKANEFVVFERETFSDLKYEEFCYAGESNNSTSTYGIRTSAVGSNYGEKFDDVHPLWEYGKIVQIELYIKFSVEFIGITYETGQSFEHGDKDGEQHIIILDEDQYITKISGRADFAIHQLKFYRNGGEEFGPYGYNVGDPFEFDFGANALVYIFGRAYTIAHGYALRQLGFAHASLSQTSTDSPTASPVTCGDNQFRYQIIIRTDINPEDVWWGLYQLPSVDSVPFMTYRKQLESYSHTGCLTIDENYEFRMMDKRRDGLCCYFGSGSYKLSVDNNVVVQGNHFDDATIVGLDWYGPDFVYNRHEFFYSSTSQPTSNPIKMTCSDEEFEYRIRVRTDNYPTRPRWYFKFSGGTIIESVEEGDYFVQHYEYNHIGCLPLDDCFEFYIESPNGLCCSSGDGGYTIFANNVVMEEGGEGYGYWSERKTFCYGPSYSHSPSSVPTSSSHPSFHPSSLCNENEFKYEVIVSTDYWPDETSWELSYDDGDGTIIDSVEQGEYTEIFTEHVHNGCLDLDSCVIFTIFDSFGDGLCCNGGYTVMVNGFVMAEGGDFDYEETKTFCYSLSYSQSPSSYPTSICNENEFKYEVIVTTDWSSDETSWELLYNDGTLIDSVGEGYYTEDYTENVHEGCLDLDSCVIFTIFDSNGNGIYTGGYTVMVNGDVMAEGGGYDGFDDEETTEFCYGPSATNYPSVSNQICDSGSDNNARCGYWASIGACDDDSSSRDWMQENCAKACANCCKDYEVNCADRASRGICTDTSQYMAYDLTWQEWMQVTCRKSCDTCDLDLTPSPTPPVTCSDDQFKYEIIFTNDDDNYYFSWNLYYKYPEQIDGYEVPVYEYNYGIVDGFVGYFPPNYEKRLYGCASYSCYDLDVLYGYVKMYDKDKDILIAQNTEKYVKMYDNTTGTLINQTTERVVEDIRFCHYAPEPTTSPTISSSPSNTPPLEAIFTITLEFSTSTFDKFEHVSAVVGRSCRKILFRAHIDVESIVLDILDYSSCEESICDISVQVCEGSCDEGEDPDFLAFVANTMNEELGNGELLQTINATADHMDVEIFDDITDVNPINIEFDFEYEAWPTLIPTSATIEPSPTPSQDCNTFANIPNLFNFISCIFQPIIQGIGDTINSATDPISDVLFGVEPYDSTAITTCKNKMFELNIEIQTDGNPDRTSWELLYENGTIIDSIGRDTYSECDTVYNHSYCLDTSCFVFNMFDSFEFKGSYNITVGDTILAQQDSFLWWKDSKHFCYPQCDDDNMFALQLELMTDDWPQETSWDLTFDNGTIVDLVEERYYTQRNTVYNHRYCMFNGCYDVTFHDHIGDGMCCSYDYGKGSFKMKINDDEVIREGGEFEDSVRKSFCHMTTETSGEESNSFLFGIITDLFGDESCCTTDMTGYPTPNPTTTSQPSVSSNPSPSISSIPSSKPSLSSNPS